MISRFGNTWFQKESRGSYQFYKDVQTARISIEAPTPRRRARSPPETKQARFGARENRDRRGLLCWGRGGAGSGLKMFRLLLYYLDLDRLLMIHSLGFWGLESRLGALLDLIADAQWKYSRKYSEWGL